MIRAGYDLGIFKALVASEEPLSIEKLAENSGADPVLFGRLLRYLASIRVVAESSKDHFAANNATKSLSDPSIEGSMYYM